MPASLPPGGAGFGLCTTRGKKSMPRSGPFRVLRHGGFGRLPGERASLRLGKGLCRPFAPESGVHGRRSSPERDGPGAGKGVLARLHRRLSGLRFGAEDLGQGGQSHGCAAELAAGPCGESATQSLCSAAGPLAVMLQAGPHVLPYAVACRRSVWQGVSHP